MSITLVARHCEGAAPSFPSTLAAIDASARRRAARERVGDVIPLGVRDLRVVGKRDEDADAPPVLVVEDVVG